jgi:deazaflavin-dependent oxidoreductase (nitroreductase family)
MAEKMDMNKVISDMDSGQMPDFMKKHLRLYLESGGKEGHMWDASLAGPGLGLVPTLLLTTVGRKTGKKRILPLIYGKVDGNYIVIGSKGGSDSHAKWYLNLLANPDAEIQVATEHFKVRARIAEGEERAKIWNHMLTVYPPYADYQARTSRHIPVVVLEKQG